MMNSNTSKAIILLYHRVASLEHDPQQLAVTPQHFEEHLTYLREHYRIQQLCDLCHEIKKDAIATDSIIITFDDGYSDNFQNAVPLVNNYNAPASIFITTGYIDSEKEFWWDELERILLVGKVPSGTLHITIADTVHSYDEVGSHRARVYQHIFTLLRNMHTQERDAVLAALRAWAGNYMPRKEYLCCSAHHLKKAAANPHIEIGSHTQSHTRLRCMPYAVQEAEITKSKHILEGIIGKDIHIFSYPYGNRHDYDEGTVHIVRDRGFHCAVSNVPGVITGETDRYNLPRFLIRDWDHNTFKQKIENFFTLPHGVTVAP